MTVKLPTSINFEQVNEIDNLTKLIDELASFSGCHLLVTCPIGDCIIRDMGIVTQSYEAEKGYYSIIGSYQANIEESPFENACNAVLKALFVEYGSNADPENKKNTHIIVVDENAGTSKIYRYSGKPNDKVLQTLEKAIEKIRAKQAASKFAALIASAASAEA